jgi:hypothetical protein
VTSAARKETLSSSPSSSEHSLSADGACHTRKAYLLIHDGRELAEHVLVMGPQFFLVLQLVLLDEVLIHIKGLPTCICKLPSATVLSKLITSCRKRHLIQ